MHFHTDYLQLPPGAAAATFPTSRTMHGRLDIPELVPLFRTYRTSPLISISDAQREPHAARELARRPCITGCPATFTTCPPARGRYLAFVGRISPEKRVDRAVEIARRLGMPLKIAAKIDGKDRDYFESEIKPLFDDPLVDFVGEIGEPEKNAFLGGAAALLFPIDWPEPFGLVMIEAMACGTPVVAFRCGSVPEVMRDGVSGYVVDTIDEAVAAHRARRRAAARARARLLRGAVLGAAHGGGLRGDLRGADRGRAVRRGRGRTAFGLAAIDAEAATRTPPRGGRLGGEAGVGME